MTNTYVELAEFSQLAKHSAKQAERITKLENALQQILQLGMLFGMTDEQGAFCFEKAQEIAAEALK